jgi:hypothetical protein
MTFPERVPEFRANALVALITGVTLLVSLGAAPHSPAPDRLQNDSADLGAPPSCHWLGTGSGLQVTSYRAEDWRVTVARTLQPDVTLFTALRAPTGGSRRGLDGIPGQHGQAAPTECSLGMEQLPRLSQLR